MSKSCGAVLNVMPPTLGGPQEHNGPPPRIGGGPSPIRSTTSFYFLAAFACPTLSEPEVGTPIEFDTCCAAACDAVCEAGLNAVWDASYEAGLNAGSEISWGASCEAGLAALPFETGLAAG
ncbi:hypothetical protein FH972_018259 [Carpinus fangiana]|uniref:Uncharacterized protein n=1 Tax=Carpinus fangiana TaxID=176857 RepID=A0A5N6RLF2_9ROSI|nr:hypothetical protein FH972_018259 [Carpinus fangiana]